MPVCPGNRMVGKRLPVKNGPGAEGRPGGQEKVPCFSGENTSLNSSFRTSSQSVPQVRPCGPGGSVPGDGCLGSPLVTHSLSSSSFPHPSPSNCSTQVRLEATRVSQRWGNPRPQGNPTRSSMILTTGSWASGISTHWQAATFLRIQKGFAP